MQHNTIESELEWILYHLWSKRDSKSPTFSFNIADTVVLRNGAPSTWYGSAPDCRIFQKKKNLTASNLSNTFIELNAGGMNLETPVATTYAYSS